MRVNRFSLRQTFALVALFAAFFALVACRLTHFRAQHRLIEDLRRDIGLEAYFVQSEKWFDWPLRMFESSDRLTDCNVLSLGGARPLTTAEQTQLLDACAKLEHLTVMNIWESNTISKAVFDSLTALGIRVDHSGLLDYRLEKNYIFVNDNFLQIDFDRSRTGLSFDPKDDRLWANLDLFHTSGHYDSPKYGLTNLQVKIPIPRQPGDLVCYRSDAKPQEDTGDYFCDGIHCYACDFRILLVSKTKNSIRLQFDFASADPAVSSDYANLREAKRVDVDVELPYHANSVRERKTLPENDFPVFETEGSDLNE